MLLTAALLAIPIGPAEAQSLAEAARREQERRKAVPAAPKVYTNADLAAGGAPQVPRPLPAPAGPPEAAAEPVLEAAEEPRDEAYWRGRITEAQQQLQRNQMFLEALQSRVNALSADFVARDDPAQRAVIAEDRQKALAEMERVKGDIQKLTKEIADIREEARRAGVPPGWLR
jgi:hypothetical protein